jgi:hypothetical protein
MPCQKINPLYIKDLENQAYQNQSQIDKKIIRYINFLTLVKIN